MLDGKVADRAGLVLNGHGRGSWKRVRKRGRRGPGGMDRARSREIS
jgi:hypothetical protein